MILVTGGAGFIGSNIASYLDEHNYAYALCDRLGSDSKWRNIAHLDPHDIISPENLLWWLTQNKQRLKAIVHMGAISSTTEKDIDLILRENYRLSRDLWQFCVDENIRFIYASSAATYGNGEQGFDDDPSPVALARLRPLNPYGWSKHLFDRFVVRTVRAKTPIPPQWAGLKFFNVYGPRELHKGSMKSVVAQIYPDAIQGRPVKLFRSHRAGIPDGGQKRDFISVDDCVSIVAWLLATPTVNGLFNAGTGQARSFQDLANAVFAAIGKPPQITYIDTPEAVRPNYQYFTEARMQRLREAGYRNSFTPLEVGVKKYIQQDLAANASL